MHSDSGKGGLRRPPEDSPYWLESIAETKQILSMVAKKGERMSLSFNGSALTTMVLEIDASQNRMWLDIGQDRQINDSAQKAENLLLSGWLDKVEVITELDHVWMDKWEGQPALCAKIPQRVHKLQRREYYRIPLPTGKPLRCSIPIGNKDKPKTVEGEVADLSVGGLCLMQSEDAGGLSPMTSYKNCSITLPDLGVVNFTMEVRHIVMVELRNGQKKARVGCRFIGLTMKDEAIIQRYMGKLERERRMMMLV